MNRAAPAKIVVLPGKTKYAREKDARDAKAAAEQAAAAAAYEEFVTTFAEEADDRVRGKTFVRGGVIQNGSKGSAPSSAAAGTEYRLGGTLAKRAPLAAFAEDDAPTERPLAPVASAGLAATASTAAVPKPMRELDSLLNELKAKKERGTIAGNTDAAAGDPTHVSAVHIGGDADPETTNVYVGNLAPSATEEMLHDLFSRHGRVVSVKVMWPRTDDERARGRNTGFVCFLTRRDAEAGIAGMADATVEGCRVNLHWAKAVRLPPAAAASAARLAFPPIPRDARAPAAASLQPSLLPPTAHSSAAPPVAASAAASDSCAAAGSLATGLAPLQEAAPLDAFPAHLRRIVVVAPGCGAAVGVDGEAAVSGMLKRRSIDLWCEYAVKDGQALETALIQREAGGSGGAAAGDEASPAKSAGAATSSSGPRHPLLAWLLLSDEPPESEAARYYRWRAYSLLRGDSLARWSTRAFQMAVGGPVWVPPPCPLPGAEDEAHRWQAAEEAAAEAGRGTHRHPRPAGAGGEGGGGDARKKRQHPHDEDGEAAGGGAKRRRRRSASPHSSSSSSSSEGEGKGAERGGRGHYGSRRRPVTQQQQRSSRRRRTRLSSSSAAEWQRLLGGLTLERRAVGGAMAWALDRAACAEELAERLLEAMRGGAPGSVGAPMPRQLEAVRGSGGGGALPAPAPAQVALLYLASDLLHNASAAVKHASTFRAALQSRLPDMLESLAECRRGAGVGRMTASGLRQRVGRVLAFWEAIAVFPPPFLLGLEAVLARPPPAAEDTAAVAATLAALAAGDDESGGGASGAAEAEEGLRAAGGGEKKGRMQQQPQPNLPARLRAQVAEEAARQCRHWGLSVAGSLRHQLCRLAWLQWFGDARVRVAAPDGVAGLAAVEQEVGRLLAAAQPASVSAEAAARPFVLQLPRSIVAMLSAATAAAAAPAVDATGAVAHDRQHTAVAGEPAVAAGGVWAAQSRLAAAPSGGGGWTDLTAAGSPGSGDTGSGTDEEDVDGVPLGSAAAAPSETAAAGGESRASPDAQERSGSLWQPAADDDDDDDVDGVPL